MASVVNAHQLENTCQNGQSCMLNQGFNKRRITSVNPTGLEID